MSTFNFCFDSLNLSELNQSVISRWSSKGTESIFSSEIAGLGVDVSEYKGFRVMAIDHNGLYMDEMEIKHNYDALAGFSVEGVIGEREFAYITEYLTRGQAEKIAMYLTIEKMKRG